MDYDISLSVAYGYGFIMILIVSLTSLLGLIILPFVQQKTCLAVAYKHLITLLITMGVAALVSDALLHLIPNVSRVLVTHALCIYYCMNIN